MSATAVKTNGRAPRVVPPPATIDTPDGSQLAAAVLRVQAEAPKLVTNADGQAGPRVYRYVTNDAVVEAVLPLLVAEGLLWRTFPTTHEDGQPALRYRMTHVESGEYEEDVMKLACILDPQGQGSGLTYARRYALTAYLNLTIDQDDDGLAAGTIQGTSEGTSEGTRTASQSPTARPARGSDRPASARQRTMIEIRVREAGLSPGVMANVLKQAGGETPVIWTDEDAATRWGKRALDRLPARLVDDVLAGIAASGGETR
jgi:hypothetical protein